VNNTKAWTLFLINPSDGSVNSSVSLTSNQYVNKSELVISANTLNYGLYKFVYTVKMLSNTVDLSPFTGQISTYVQIVPSGITVLGLNGGVNQIQIGLNQTFVIDPTKYSYDSDNKADIKSLNFLYFCNVLDQGVSTGFPTSSQNSMIDLYSFKSGQYSMSYNTTCFSSSSN
jgi:hypothetical protein